jgi:hypothetical protein
MTAASQLSCSPAYIHVRFRRYGLKLQEVLEAPDIETVMATISEGHHDG